AKKEPMSQRISSLAKAASVLLVVGVLLVVALSAGCAKDTPDALVASAKEYLAKNDPKAAIIELRNAVQKKPDFGEARFLLGKTLLDGGDVLTAERELRKAMELDYAPDQVIPQLARALLT